MSIATKSGANSAPAVNGSITRARIGIPIIANPPPKLPFMKAMKNTPASVRSIVAGSSILFPYPVVVFFGADNPSKLAPPIGSAKTYVH